MTDTARPPTAHDPTQTADLIALVAVFAAVDPAVLQEIAAIATPVDVDTDEALVRQGDPGDALYVLLAGTFEVVLELATGASQTLAKLGPGECVGELALLTHRPRAASVIARGPARALRVTADALDRILDRHPAERRRLLDYAARRLPSLRLASTGLFVGVDPQALARFDNESNWVRIRGNEALFRQGDPADDMYVVVHGSLEVIIEGTEGRSRLVDVLDPGDSVGEMALLSDEPRSATVRAIRDSELVRIPRDEFFRLLDEHPRTAIELARTLVNRLRQTTSTPRLRRFARTVALVPAHRNGMPADFAPRLREALGSGGDAVLSLSSAGVDAELGPGSAHTRFEDFANGRLLNWLNEREERYRYVLYDCDADLSPWTERCLRQADIVLVVADAGDDPEPGEIERALLQPVASEADVTPPRYELVLLHRPGIAQPSGTIRWRRARADGRLGAHHHIRLDRARDLARLARSIAGSSLGLALSGGCARGFAHFGVIRALEEQGLDIDMIGGASMGSVVAGLHAVGHELSTSIALCLKHFVAYNGVGDLTVPMVALLRGASNAKLMRDLFGDVQIEDLWTPYFCVSANLSRAEVVVHSEGPLWLWTRASSSVPGLDPPIPWRGDLLVDGGVLDNLPVDVMRERIRGSVVAVDVGASVELRTTLEGISQMSGWPHLARAINPLDKSTPFPNIARILMRTVTLGGTYNQNATRALADLYLHPPTDGVDMLDWKAINQIVEIGYRYAYDEVTRFKSSDRRVMGAPSAVRRSAAWER